MNTTFNIQRFCNLFANEWQIYFKKIALLWGGLIGIAVLYFGFFASIGDRAQVIGTIMMFFMAVLAFQGFIISIHFGDFSSKTRTQSLLLLPASSSEKFIAKFIPCMIIFPLMVCLYYWLLMQVNLAYNSWAEESFGLAAASQSDSSLLNQFFTNHRFLYLLLGIWFFAGCSFLCGSLTFKKLAPVKTFLALLLCFFVMIPIIALFYAIVSGHFPDVYVPFLYIAEKNDLVQPVVGPITDNNSFHFSLMSKYTYYPHCIILLAGLYLLVVSRIKFNEKTV